MHQDGMRRARFVPTGRAGAIAGLSLAVLAGPWSVIAAEEAAPAPRARVRLTTSKGRLVARFVELNGDSIVLEQPKWGGAVEKLSVERRDVVGFEVSERPSRKGKGARIGILAGLGAAVAIGALGGESCASDPGPADWSNFSSKLDSSTCLSHFEAGLLSGIVTVPLGALVGAAVMPGEKWRPAAVGGLSVQPVAARGRGFGVRVAFGF